jgi:hypothetical protein
MVANLKTEAECLAYCTDCVATKLCWVDATIGSPEDLACKTSCYDTCAAHLGSSDLCDCAEHGACVNGCDSNCAGYFEDSCVTECEANMTAFDCTGMCDNCVNTLTCWTDVSTYYGSADESCSNNCYVGCGTRF